MKKKVLEIAMIATVSLTSLAGCGDSQNSLSESIISEGNDASVHLTESIESFPSDEWEEEEISYTIEESPQTEELSTQSDSNVIWFDSEEKTEIVIDGQTIRLKVAMDDFREWANQNQFDIQIDPNYNNEHINWLYMPSGSVELNDMEGELLSMFFFAGNIDLSKVSVDGFTLDRALELKEYPNVIIKSDICFELPIADHTTIQVVTTTSGDLSAVYIMRDNLALRNE